MDITIVNAEDSVVLKEMVQASGMRQTLEVVLMELRKTWKYGQDEKKANFARAITDLIYLELRDNDVTLID